MARPRRPRKRRRRFDGDQQKVPPLDEMRIAIVRRIFQLDWIKSALLEEFIVHTRALFAFTSSSHLSLNKRLLAMMMTMMMSAQKRTPTPRVVLLKNEQKKTSSSSCVVKSRPSVKARFPKDIANACERFPSEFELRATLDAQRSGGRPEEDAKRSTRNNISSALRLREVFPEVSEASIVFLERDIEAVVRDFREFVVKESDGSWETKKKVVVLLSLLRRTLCTKLHVDHVRVRAMTTYCGKKTEVLDEDSVAHAIVAKAAANEAGPMARALRPVADALKSNAKAFEKKLVKERGESCDILFLKGEMWESGKASVHRSPETTNGGWRLVLRVDEYDAVNEAEEHHKCVVDDKGRGREE